MKKTRILGILLFSCFVLILFLAVVFSRPAAVSSFSLGDRPLSVWIIDAGHGGADGGAVSPDGVTESQLNLEISLRLRDLADLLGIETVLTREDDVSIYTEGETLREQKRSDLRHRVELADGVSKGLLLSIHQNMFEQSRYKGAQTFYNALPESRLCAESIQEKLREAVDPDNDRLSKAVSEDVYLMKNVTCPAVLVECGFLSNPEECARLQQPETQKKLILAIAAGVLDREQEGEKISS